MKVLKATTVLACLAGLAACSDRSGEAFRQAKADKAKRPAYMKGLFDKMVWSEKANPEGILQAWFHLSDATQEKAAREAILVEYKAQDCGEYYEQDIEDIIGAVKSGGTMILPFYHTDVIFRNRPHAGLLLVGDIFSLKSERELLSLLEYARTYAQVRENGLTVRDHELDQYIPAMVKVSGHTLIPFYARSVQVENTLKKGDVSDPFREKMIRDYAASHTEFLRDFNKQKEILNHNNENYVQKEVVKFMEDVRGDAYDRLQQAGYEHKPAEALH